MKNKKTITSIENLAQKQLINKLVLKNLKGGGIIGCPPPIFD